MVVRTWRAKMDTPPVPWVKTVSPGINLLPSTPYKAFHAVRAAQGRVLPCLKSNDSGIFTSPFSLKAPYWRRVPSRAPPRPVPTSATVIFPARCDWLKRVRTASPFLKRETRGPVATMVPAPSDAGTIGRAIGNGYLPCDKSQLRFIALEHAISCN